MRLIEQGVGHKKEKSVQKTQKRPSEAQVSPGILIWGGFR